MIAEIIKSGNAVHDLETAKAIDIVSCKRVGKYRHNYPRSISITFAKRDDKESFLSNKRQLLAGIFTNEEYPLMTYTPLSQVPPSISRQMQNGWRLLDDKWHYIQSRRYTKPSS